MDQDMQYNRLIDDLVSQLTIRSKSLIVTVYGDSILPHGGTTWLGSLIKLLEPFGLGDRMVRTAVFRLTKDDWLSATQSGRKSFYSLTKTGQRRFESAQDRIYAQPEDNWDGKWHLVQLIDSLNVEDRDALRRELGWQGYGAFSPTLLAHPRHDEASTTTIIKELGLEDRVVRFTAHLEDSQLRAPISEMVNHCWKIAELSKSYETFVSLFQPVLDILEKHPNPSDETCFVIRTLLIHEFRRLLLKDPELPMELLPDHWPGQASRVLTNRIYHITHGPAMQHITSALESLDGPLPLPSDTYYQRFGGLAPTEPTGTAERKRA